MSASAPAGNATTGVPHAIASIATSELVSAARLGAKRQRAAFSSRRLRGHPTGPRKHARRPRGGRISASKYWRCASYGKTSPPTSSGVSARRAASIGEDCLDAAMGDLFRLHERRWANCGESGVCGDPRVQGFHRAAAARLLSAGMLRLYRLRIAGAVAAVYYGVTAKGTAYAYLGGFDPSQPRLSPGLQIIGHAIEQAIAEGASRFDFLRGTEGYKHAWGAVDRGKLSVHWSRRCASR